MARKPITPEQAIAQVEHRREYTREWLRQYRREHPERLLASRIRQAKTLLEKHGYTVLESSNTCEKGGAE